MLLMKTAHSYGAVEIVAHEKPAAQQELAELGDLGIGELPVAHLDGIEPRIIEHVVVLVEVDGLLGGAGLDAGEAADGGGEVAVGAGVIDGPVGVAVGPVQAAKLPVDGDVEGGVHEAGEGPLARLVIVRRDGKIVVLPGRVLAKRPLRAERAHQ